MNIAVRALVFLVVAGCACPPAHEAKVFAPGPPYAAQIDACLAMDVNCEALCRAALELPMQDVVTKCVVTSEHDGGVDLDVIYYTPCSPD
jgi:hypothetical protein